MEFFFSMFWNEHNFISSCEIKYIYFLKDESMDEIYIFHVKFRFFSDNLQFKNVTIVCIFDVTHGNIYVIVSESFCR